MAKSNKKPTISLDNRPVSPLVQEDPKPIPKGFVNIKKTVPVKKEGKDFNVSNFRPYKKLDNYYGMWADTGEVFRLDSLR